MSREATAPGSARQAKGVQSGVSGRSARKRESSGAACSRKKGPSGASYGPLSPSIEDELSRALELTQGTEKVEGLAGKMGWSRTGCFDRLRDPIEELSFADVLRLFQKCPDPRLNGRIRAHLSALDSYQAIAEREAGASYVRIQLEGVGQRPLPLERVRIAVEDPEGEGA